jgi:hypothetical protein
MPVLIFLFFVLFPALAQAQDSNQPIRISDTQSIVLLSVVLVLIVALCTYIGVLHKNLMIALRDATITQERLTILSDLPGGVPEGTIRATLSVFIVVLCVGALVFLRGIGVEATGEIGTVLGSVLGFYFWTRTSGEPDRAALGKQATVIASLDDRNRELQEQGKAAEQQAVQVRQEADQRVREADTQVQTAVSTATEASDRLVKARSTLRMLRVAAQAAAAVAPDEPLVARAKDVADRLDQGFQAAETALRDRDPASIASAASAAEDLIKTVGADHPAAVILGDGLGAFGRVLGVAATAGIGGPIGLVAALGFGSLRAFQQGTEYYERWKALVLERTYTPNLFPAGAIDAPTARSAIEASPIFARIFAPQMMGADWRPHAVAIAEAALRRDDLRDALALLVASTGQRPVGVQVPPHGTPGGFASDDEFEAGIQEFRQQYLFNLVASPVVTPAGAEALTSDPNLSPLAREAAATPMARVISLLHHASEVDPKDRDPMVLLLTRLVADSETTPSRLDSLLSMLLPAAQAHAAKGLAVEQKGEVP